MKARQLVDTLLTETEWTFKTEVTDVDISLDEHSRFSSGGGKAVIFWSLDPDLREWGVKDMTPVVHKFLIEVNEEFYDEVRDEDIERRHRFTEADFKDYEITTTFKHHEDEYGYRSRHMSIAPCGIEVNYRQKKVIITF